MRQRLEPDGFAARSAKPAVQQVLELFEDGDRALIGADVAELRRIYADDYIQYDERGRAATKPGLIDDLNSGRIRFVSMESTGRSIRIVNENFAVVHGFGKGCHRARRATLPGGLCLQRCSG
jgi:Domain of unknown function (DUF4440)